MMVMNEEMYETDWSGHGPGAGGGSTMSIRPSTGGAGAASARHFGSATGGAVATAGAVRPVALPVSPSTPWPRQAQLILSAIEAAGFGGSNRRGVRRRRYRTTAALKLYSDPTDADAWTLYTRDVHSRGLGFITPYRLPLGHGGVVELSIGNGKTTTIPCTLLRCREAAPGWFEGSLYFNRDQPQFQP